MKSTFANFELIHTFEPTKQRDLEENTFTTRRDAKSTKKRLRSVRFRGGFVEGEREGTGAAPSSRKMNTGECWWEVGAGEHGGQLI